MSTDFNYILIKKSSNYTCKCNKVMVGKSNDIGTLINMVNLTQKYMHCMVQGHKLLDRIFTKLFASTFASNFFFSLNLSAIHLIQSHIYHR